MASYTGAARFANEDLLYFVWVGSSDAARPRLFASMEEAEAAWRDPQKAVPRHCPEADAEPVDLMPYFGTGDQRVHLRSIASRSAMRITGPLCVEEADAASPRFERWGD